MRSKFSGVEILRFFSSILILFWHYQHFAYVHYSKSLEFEKHLQPFYKFFSYFYKYGYLSVYIFWLVSGFIFFYVYYDKVNKSKYKFYNFLTNRFARLYPLHFISLLLVLFMQYLYFEIYNEYYVYKYNDLKHFILNIFFISHWGLQEGYSFNGPIWSVSVEIIIYFIFFFLTKNFKILFNFILGFIIYLLFLIINPSISNCVILFYIGGYLSLSKFNYKVFGKNKFIKNLNLINITISTVVIIFIYSINDGKYHTILKYLCVIYALIVSANLDYIIKILKLNSVFNYLGSLTYSIYLMGFPIQILIFLLYSLFQIKLNYQDPVLFFLYFCLVLLISHISFKYFELPIKIKIKKYFYSL